MTEVRRVSSAHRPLPHLSALPDEVIESIFRHLDVKSLVATSSVAKKFTLIASERLLWRHFCIRDFEYWDGRHEFKSRQADPSFQDWKDLYVVRYTANFGTRQAIQAMIKGPNARLARAQKILEHGYGTKDELMRLIQDAPTSTCPLAQRYYAQMVLGCLNRSLALETWTKIRYRSDIQNPTVLSLACMDMFIIESSKYGDVNDTLSRLNGYVDAVRQAYPDIDEQSPRTKAVTIANFLRSKKWLGIEEGDQYYALDNQFLGVAVRSERRNALPLLTCVIYCHVCNAFNLRAQPCSFPMHVHAVIQPPISDPPIDIDGQPLPSDHPSLSTPAGTEPEPSSLTHLYMDPFHSHTPITLSYLRSQFRFVAPNASTSQLTSCLSPASPRALLIRTAHNIIRSVTTHTFPPPNHPISIYNAAYAALFALVMFPTSPDGLASSLADLRQHFAHHFPHDLFNYQTYILPLITGLGSFGGDRGVHDPLVKLIRDEDLAPKTPKIRPAANDILEPGENIPIYKVGQVFRHKRQGYTAVIYGWDTACKMEERWIVGNGVDSLPKGRTQPFYNAYVDDGSTRYVAQENVGVLGPDQFGPEDVDRTFGADVGKWFLRFETSTATFASNVRDEYPED